MVDMTDAERHNLRDLIIDSKVKMFAEALGLTWAEWKALEIPRRDRLALAAYRFEG